MPDHAYYRGARAADSILEEHGNDLPAWATQADVDLEKLIHLANQRALRCILTGFMGLSPSELNLRASEERAYAIPSHLEQFIPVFAACFIDGWAARHHLQPQTGV